MMFVGLSNGNFYGIIDCRSNVQHAGSKCRAAGADARYVYIERNFERHGDKKRHSFVYGADNKVGIDAVEVHVTDGDYETTARSWYTLGARQTLGWTAPYSFASVSVTGTTYATSIRDASGDVLGVVGADHVGDEPRARARATTRSASRSRVRCTRRGRPTTTARESACTSARSPTTTSTACTIAITA